jgi:hypothetical protein
MNLVCDPIGLTGQRTVTIGEHWQRCGCVTVGANSMDNG